MEADRTEYHKQYHLEHKEEAIARATLWNKNNKERRKKIALASWHKNKHKLDKTKLKDNALRFDHGISLEQFNQMLKDQDNKCSVCGLTFSNKHKTTKPHVDHDHVTDKIRSLLCHGCNIGLGMFKDNVSTLSKAINYLNNHATPPIRNS